jgi:hypothetical protein
MMIGSPEITNKKPAAVAVPQQMRWGPTVVDATTNQPPITLTVVLTAMAAVVAAMAALHMAAADAMVVVKPEDEATGTAALAATNVAATMPAAGSMRYTAPKRQPTSVTTTASPPTPIDFTLYYYPRSSSLSGSTSTTRSNTQYYGSGVTP